MYRLCHLLFLLQKASNTKMKQYMFTVKEPPENENRNTPTEMHKCYCRSSTWINTLITLNRPSSSNGIAAKFTPAVSSRSVYSYPLNCPREEMWLLVILIFAALSQTIFSEAFSRMKFLYLIIFSLKCVPTGPIENNPALCKIMAWCRPCVKPLFEPMLTQFNNAWGTSRRWFNPWEGGIVMDLGGSPLVYLSPLWDFCTLKQATGKIDNKIGSWPHNETP